MFRIKHVEKKYINKTFRFPASLMQKLEKTADENDISVNELMRQCAEYALGNMQRISQVAGGRVAICHHY